MNGIYDIKRININKYMIKNKKLHSEIKLTVIGVVWFLAIVTWATMLFGCASNNQEEHHLLHRDELIAYKSVTIKDYKCEEEC